MNYAGVLSFYYYIRLPLDWCFLIEPETTLVIYNKRGRLIILIRLADTRWRAERISNDAYRLNVHLYFIHKIQVIKYINYICEITYIRRNLINYICWFFTIGNIMVYFNDLKFFFKRVKHNTISYYQNKVEKIK